MSARNDIEQILAKPNTTRELATDEIRRARAKLGSDGPKLEEFSDALEKLMPRLKALPSTPPPDGGGGTGSTGGGGTGSTGGGGSCDEALKAATEALDTAKRAENIARTTAAFVDTVLAEASKIAGELNANVKDKHARNQLERMTAAVRAAGAEYHTRMATIGQAPGTNPPAPAVHTVP